VDQNQLAFALECIIGRDITKKLYSMSENVGRAAAGGGTANTGHHGASGGSGDETLP